MNKFKSASSLKKKGPRDLEVKNVKKYSIKIKFKRCQNVLIGLTSKKKVSKKRPIKKKISKVKSKISLRQ